LASLLAVASAVATVGAGLFVIKRRAVVAEPNYLEGAYFFVLIPLLSPQGWDYLLLLATPAVVCLMDRWREFPRLWQWGLGFALALMGLSSFDLMGRALYGRFMSLSIISVCALVVAVGLIHARRLRLA